MMKKIKTINIDSVGEVFFRKSERAKYVSITIKPGAGVIVSVPRFVSIKSAEKIAKSKVEWIKKKLIKIEEFESRYTIFDETTLFSTRKHKLKIQKTDLEKISIVLKESLIYVNYPAQTDVSSTEVQQAVKNGIEKALRIEAKEYLPGRVQELAEKFCFEYNKVFLKNLRSRWGSCSHKNNINLNIHLMRLPDKLIDYVIFHELTHTVEKNHSKKFWALLKTLNTDSKKLDKELKKYSPLKLSV